jgi:hypothetical protein
MAISHLMDVGIRHLTEDNIAETCAAIMKEDDSLSFMTNEYKCDLVKTAGKLAKMDHAHLLTYISREVYYDVDREISYNRAIVLLKSCIEALDEHHSVYDDVYVDLVNAGFSDEELYQLGYGYLLDLEEDE